MNIDSALQKKYSKIMLKAKRNEYINSKLLLAAILIIVIVGGAYFLSVDKKNQKPAPFDNYNYGSESLSKQSQPAQIENIPYIDVTSSGFSPAIITVKTGTLVAWANKSGRVISLNSDNHPTHEIYPRLNLGDIASGSTMGVIFDKAGTYTYHNHYKPTQTGTVVVE